MLDPHTKESRGFGFVKMVTGEQADAAKEGLQGEVIEGRTLSIEKARRSRPRTPTPGKYFGPPKRGMLPLPSCFKHALTISDDPRGPPPARWGGRDSYDDRRRGGFRDDPYSYRSRGDDRGDRGYPRRDDRDGYAPRGIDRYGGRDDRYSSRGDDRRGGYADRYDRGDRGDRGGDRDGGRSSRDAGPPAAYGEPAPRGDAREPYGGRYNDDRDVRRAY